MKQAADRFTQDMIDAPKRGRPAKPDALTPAQRARLYRQRHKNTVTVIQAVTQKRETYTATEDEWPFPGTYKWYQMHGFVMAPPEL